mgnify:CR=1 FL=1
MKIYDLTHQINPQMSVYPGTDKPIFEVGSSLEGDGFKERRLTIFSHTGTHADAPAHLFPDGKTLDQYPIDSFMGVALLVDVSHLAGGQTIEVSAFYSISGLLGKMDFLILRTGASSLWGSPEYFSTFPTLSHEAANYLTEFSLKAIGCDAISFDAVGSVDLPIHHILLEKELFLIENLTGLEPLPVEEIFQFACLPLNLAEADGAPVRAVAVI